MGTRTRLLTYFCSILCISLILNFVSFRTPLEQNAYEKEDYQHHKSVSARLIVLTRNRAKSLTRLLDSAANATYGNDRVDMDIWIDRIEDNLAIDNAVLEVSNNFKWRYGEKVVHSRRKRAGLYEQWLYTWDLTTTLNTDEFAIILEDDLQLAPSYYAWLKEARRRYDNDPQVGGYTLQRLRFQPRSLKGSQHVLYVPNGIHAFKYRLQGSWGTVPKREVWLKFRHWYETQSRLGRKPYMPNFALTSYYKKGENTNGFNPNVWTQWYNKFVDEMGYFSVIAHPPGRATLCANWKEAGPHYNGGSTSPDYPLYRGNLSLFKWPQNLVAFDWDGTIVNTSKP